MDFNVNELRQASCELACIGAKVADEMFGKVSTSRKSDNTPVTAADHAAQEAMLRELARRYPTHAIIVEEHVASPEQHAALNRAEYCWVIDPIDGTRNYGRGLKVYGTSVAVLHHGRPVAGAVHDASQGVLYSAARGYGAFRDDSRINITDRAIDSDTTIAVSSFRRRAMPAAVREWLEKFLFRNQGAVSLHLASVAAGVIDGAVSVDCKLWDIAAGALLIEEAGGVITDLGGRPLWPIDLEGYDNRDLPAVAGHRTLHEHLVTSLNAR